MLRFLLILILLLQPLGVRAADEQALQQSGLVDPSAGIKNKRRVAVMPFDTPKNQPDMEQYGAGTMDTLIFGLKNIPTFILVDRARIDRVIKEQAFGQSGLVNAKTAPKVGKLLGAQLLITGSINTAGSGDARKVRITAHFLDVETGVIQASKQVGGTLSGIFDLQEQLANQFLNQQKITVTAEQQQRMTKVIKSTASLTAYDYFLKGRKAYLKYSSEGNEEAMRWFRKAIETDGSYALAYAGLAEAADAQGTDKYTNGEAYLALYEDAYAAAKRAIELNPDLAVAHRALGIAGDYLQKGGRAEESRLAVNLDPNDAENWLALWHGTMNNENPDHEYILKAIQLNPDLIGAHIDRGNALGIKQRFEESIAEFRAALRINPRNAIGQYNLGNSLASLNRCPEAIPAFEASLRLEPNNSYAQNSLGYCLRAVKRYAEAVTQLQASVRVRPDNVSAWSNLGGTLADLKRYEEAIAAYRQVLKLKPDATSEHYQIGSIMFAQKRYEDVIAEYKELLRATPNDGIAHANIGLALAYLKRYEEAVAEDREALRLVPTNAPSWFQLGFALARLGKKDEAIQAYENYLKFAPNAQDAPQVRERIQKLRAGS